VADSRPGASVSESAQYLRLVLHGILPASSDAAGFFVTADAIADSVEEALLFAREIDDFDDAEITVEEVTDLGPEPGQPKGVYAIRGRTYYKKTDQGSD
jgi:hypothetical protein